MSEKQSEENKNATALLSKVAMIVEHHADLAKKTGENFNLMKILKMGHYEVKTHSPILADLLDPNGSHGQGDIFLRLFLERLNSEETLTNLNVASATVLMEKGIGMISDNRENGGRIDIHIEDAKGNRILIENKIHAHLQHNQLLRYHNYDTEAVLIFLTLKEESPEKTTEDIKGGFVNMTYQSDIILWLENCRKEVATVPVIRESITQYINLLKDLTKQNTNIYMSQKIAKTVLENQESFNAFLTLDKAQWDMKAIILEQLTNNLTKLAEKGDMTFKPIPQDCWHNKESYSFFERKEWNERNIRIGFGFENRGYSGFAFGISSVFPEKMTDEEVEFITKKAAPKSTFREINNRYWPAWQYWGEYKNWDLEIFGKVHFGSFLDDFEEKLTMLTGICDSLTKDQDFIRLQKGAGAE